MMEFQFHQKSESTWKWQGNWKTKIWRKMKRNKEQKKNRQQNWDSETRNAKIRSFWSGTSFSWTSKYLWSMNIEISAWKREYYKFFYSIRGTKKTDAHNFILTYENGLCLITKNPLKNHPTFFLKPLNCL